MTKTVIPASALKYIRKELLQSWMIYAENASSGFWSLVCGLWFMVGCRAGWLKAVAQGAQRGRKERKEEPQNYKPQTPNPKLKTKNHRLNTTNPLHHFREPLMFQSMNLLRQGFGRVVGVDRAGGLKDVFAFVEVFVDEVDGDAAFFFAGGEDGF